ncbi:MAG: Uma2 family endonuclease [Longimicrobiales bacterium]
MDITSDSTEEYDRGEKLRHYQQLPSLRHVVIVSHREPHLTLHQHEDAGWAIVEARRGDAIALEGVGARLAVDDVYGDELEDARR